MFAARFFRPALRTATRSFTTTTKVRTPFTRRWIYQSPISWSARRSTIEWQSAFRRAQTRGYARQAFNYQRFQASRSLFKSWAARPTFYYEVGGICVLFGGYYIMNLEPVPVHGVDTSQVSGRMRFMIVSPELEKSTAQNMYNETLREYGNKIMSPQTKEHQMVERVLNRLLPHSGLQGEQWEIHVIDVDEKNAFVIPGGKVFVFRGILDICQGDDGLAAVLGHEIAHNVAHHAGERMSQYGILLPVGILIYLFAGVDPGIINFVSNLAFTLPGSRKQEAEADYIGLMMMAESCYNPEAAVGLWSRMEQAEQGAPPQFLSTHPSSHNRLEKIRGWLPAAETKLEDSDCRITAGYANDFRRTFDNQRW